MVLSPRRDATQHTTTASHNELVVRRPRDIRNAFILLNREQRNPQTLSRRATRDAASEAASACAAREASRLSHAERACTGIAVAWMRRRARAASSSASIESNLKTYGWVARAVETSNRLDVLSFKHHLHPAKCRSRKMRLRHAVLDRVHAGRHDL
jgi:hypothetical protein